MVRLYRQRPPRIRQSLQDSCWAAVIESWSTVTPRISRQQESALIGRYGEGPTGGITPAQKIPALARALQLQWGGFEGPALDGYLRAHLGRSHVFCAHRAGRFQHAVLIYGYDGNNVHFMDPRNGTYETQGRQWLQQRGPFAMMRR